MPQVVDRLPDPVKRHLRKHVKKWAHVVPSWCHTLHVRFEPEMDDGHIANIIGRPQYREALLRFGPLILDRDEGETEDVVKHELLHLHQEEAHDVFIEALDFVPESVRELLEARYHYANEGAVCDLMRVLT